MTQYPVLRAQVSAPGTFVPDIERELVEVSTTVTYPKVERRYKIVEIGEKLMILLLSIAFAFVN